MIKFIIVTKIYFVQNRKFYCMQSLIVLLQACSVSTYPPTATIIIIDEFCVFYNEQQNV